MINSTRLFSIARTSIRSCGKVNQLRSVTPLFHSNMSTKQVVVNPAKVTFQEVFPEIVDLLLKNPQLQDAKFEKDTIKEILYYNLNGGKYSRGLTTVLSYEMLEKPENITDESIRLACIVGWCTEMLHAYLLMGDDIMDGSVQRRGVPCWYALPNVGLRAVNDSVLVYTTMHSTLKSYFRHMPQYSDMLDLMNEALMLTAVGQLLDTSMAQRGKNDFTLFTMDRYDAIVKYKTSFYTFKLPICAGMLLANINDDRLFNQVEEITLKIGSLFQLQDDYIDVYGSSAVTGKLGTDIQAGKCSWLAVTALARCNDVQKAVFMTSYGNEEPVCVERIKKLYHALDIPKLYLQDQQRRYDEIVKLVNKLDASTRLPELFTKILNDIYNREK